MSITVVKPGLLSSVQDRGRHGMAALGVGCSGPMDANLFRLAQALAGNEETAAGIEITVTGPLLRFEHACRIALTGDFARPRINGVAAGCWRPLLIHAGSELDCGPLQSGTRGYLAISGGINVVPVLGSRSTDLNACIGANGGRQLQAGDVLPTAAMPMQALRSINWSLDPSPWFDSESSHPIHCIAGRHRAALDNASIRALDSEEFRVASDSNRVGFRFDGPTLRLSEPLEPISEPVSFGTVQLPAGGQPIALMAEHPTTGGYPCIAQVAAIDRGRLAQRRPGERVRFAWLSVQQAQARYLVQQRELASLIRSIGER